MRTNEADTPFRCVIRGLTVVRAAATQSRSHGGYALEEELTRRLILGSLSHYLADHAPCPLLILPPGTGA